MLKKIIFLVSMFSYITPVSADSKSLTPQEAQIYNTLKKEYSNINNTFEINTFLEKNNILAQQLYDILTRKLSLLSDQEKFLKSLNESTIVNVMVPSGPVIAHSPMGLLAYAGAIAASLIYGVPTLAIGLAIKQFVAPSPSQATISSGLIGIGGLVSIPAALAGLTLTASKIELFLKKIIYDQQNINKQLEAINEEKKYLLQNLRLIKLQPTYQ